MGMKVKDVDALREQISNDPREAFTKHQVWLLVSEHNKTVPTVEAIPKADYEARLKADLVAMLEDLDLQIDEFDSGCGWAGYIKKIDVQELIQQKINDLKVVEDGKNNE